MFEEIASRYHTELSNVPAIGDSARDIQAAFEAGAKPILVRTGKGAKTSNNGDLPPNVRIFDNLAAAARALIAEP